MDKKPLMEKIKKYRSDTPKRNEIVKGMIVQDNGGMEAKGAGGKPNILEKILGFLSRTPEPGEEHYRYDRIDIDMGEYGQLALALLVLPIIVASGLATAISDILGPIVFISSLLIIFLVPQYIIRRKTPFELSKTMVGNFDHRLLIYEEGIEFRENLSTFFIPYDKLIKLSGEKKFFHTVLLIESKLPGVPPEISFGTKHANAILEMIQPLCEDVEREAKPAGEDQ